MIPIRQLHQKQVTALQDCMLYRAERLPAALQVAMFLAELVIVNVVPIIGVHEALFAVTEADPVLRHVHMYTSSSSYFMWHVRAYFKRVAENDAVQMHELFPASQPFDHAYVCRRFQEQLGTLATGSQPLFLRRVRPSQGSGSRHAEAWLPCSMADNGY